jgi:TetR/AcrR family transcriptional regulator
MTLRQVTAKKAAQPAQKASRSAGAGRARPGPVPQGKRGKAVAADSAEGLREVILAVAAEEFAAKGYDGARIEAITVKSKVSRNLIYYYFQSKENLFTCLLEDAYTRMRDYLSGISFEGKPPDEAIRHLIRSLFEYWSGAREFIGFLNSENFYRARHLKKSRATPPQYPKLMASIQAVLDAGRASGAFKAEVAPRDLYLSISGLIYHFLANQYTLSYLFQTDFSSRESMESYLEHTEQVVLGFLRCGNGRR